MLAGISLSHFLNDTMQSLIASVYPILKDNYALDFAQIGMITLAFQFTASLLQPVVGHFTDRKAQPFSLAIGMGFTFFGLLLLSVAQQYPVILIAAALVGLGSAVFHPESARIARLASGGRYGFAQSVFQLGGSFGTSMGPLLAALIVVPFGQPSIAWFSSIAFLAIVILWRIGRLVQAADHDARRRRRSMRIRTRRVRAGSRSRWWCWSRCCSPSSSTCRACRAITSSI